MNKSNNLKIRTDTGSFSGGSGVAKGTRAGQFSSANVYDALQSATSSGSRESGDSNSPGASDSSSGTFTGKTGAGRIHPVVANRDRAKMQGQQYTSPSNQMAQAMRSPQSLRRMSATPMSPGSFGSPMRVRGPGPENGFGQKARRGSMNSQGTPMPLYVPPQMREGMMNQTSGNGQPTQRRRSTASSTQNPMLHPSIDTKQGMMGINQGLAVQEFAFRRGQADRDAGRDRMLKNPFGPPFDAEWARYYLRGKESVVPRMRPFPNPPSPSRENFAWAPLVNPYTQSQEHPNGCHDVYWVRHACMRALDGMAALIMKVVARGSDWGSIVCDVPKPIQDVLPEFPDLQKAYEDLKRDAQEAAAGGRPCDAWKKPSNY